MGRMPCWTERVVIPYQVRSYQTGTELTNSKLCPTVVIPYQVRSYQTYLIMRKCTRIQNFRRNPLSSQVISNLGISKDEWAEMIRGRNPLSSQVISNCPKTGKRYPVYCRNPLSSQVISNFDKHCKHHRRFYQSRNPLSSQVISNVTATGVMVEAIHQQS